MNITPTSIQILERSILRFEDHARSLQASYEFEGVGLVGKIVRESMEQSWQDAAVVADFVKRYKQTHSPE